MRGHRKARRCRAGGGTIAPGAASTARAGISIAAVAGLAAILEPHAYPSYDYAFAMASAQDVLSGRTTGYDVAVFSPVPHPLTLIEAFAVVPLGDLAFPVFTALALLAFGLLCWSVLQIGTAVASWPAGLVAGVLVFTSPPIFELATRTYGDVAFAALVAAALALEVGRRRRGRAVLAVLAPAGLLRPEAWLLSAAYWLYLGRVPGRERLVLAGLVVAAPVLWMAMDVALTGDPLHSLDVTRTYTEKAQAAVSAHDLWIAMRALAGWPVLAGAVAGALLAAWRRDRRAALPLVAGAIVFLATVGPAVAGESPVLRRYLLVPAAIVSLSFAIACLGWTRAPPTPAPARVAGVGLLVVAVALMAGGRVDRWRGHRRAQATRVALLEHLRHWATSPRPRSYLMQPACRPVLVPGYGYRPYLRLWLDVPPRAVAFHFGDPSPSRGLVLLPTAADEYQRVMLAEVGRGTRRHVLADPRFRARFRRVARSPHWEMYAEAVCRRAVARDGQGPRTSLPA